MLRLNSIVIGIMITLWSCERNTQNAAPTNTESGSTTEIIEKTDSITIIEDTIGIDIAQLNENQTKIEKQIWSNSNLDITIFKNGETIFYASNAEDWKDFCYEGKLVYCYYNFDTANKSYGKIYNSLVAEECRTAFDDWAIPTNQDWESLNKFLLTDSSIDIFENDHVGEMARAVKGDISFANQGVLTSWWSIDSVGNISKFIMGEVEKKSYQTPNPQYAHTKGNYIRLIKK
jgi:uncharacterized protein (TIGR02145 family)